MLRLQKRLGGGSGTRAGGKGLVSNKSVKKTGLGRLGLYEDKEGVDETVDEVLRCFVFHEDTPKHFIDIFTLVVCNGTSSKRSARWMRPFVVRFTSVRVLVMLGVTIKNAIKNACTA